MNSLFQELLLISVGKKSSFSNSPSIKDWQSIFAEVKKQSLVGICFVGIEHLPHHQRPYIELLMEWVGRIEYIKRQNSLVDRRAAEVSHIFSERGLHPVVLKGQGVARLYPNPELRTPGDIDLWVDGSRDESIDFMKQMGWKVGRTVIHHTEVKIFPDVEVEIHHIPSFSYNPFRYRKYKSWFQEKYRDQRFAVRNDRLGFARPSIEFDTVYSLLHIFRHVFHEGIGLRQLLDYYYILTHTTEKDRSEAMQTLRWFGLERFAAAVMYVEQEYFELENDFLLCDSDSEGGQFLLTEILQNGNFGRFNEQANQAHSKGLFQLYFHNLGRLLKMLKYYPTEVLWAPIWKPVHYLWRIINRY